MKDKSFIYYSNPCLTPLDDPSVQRIEDAQGRTVPPCPLYADRRNECSAPDYACIRVAGAAMARYVIQFYSEATEQTLAMEKEEFLRRAPLPPDGVKAYVDISDHNVVQITDRGEIAERVWKYARAALDIKPGERIFRSPEEIWAPPGEKPEEPVKPAGK